MLTPDEEVRVYHHLGYPQVKTGRAFFLGYYSSIPVTTMLEGSLLNIKPQAEEMVRRLLERLDGVESQMLEDQELAAVTKVDEIEVNQNEFQQLLSQYKHWQLTLGNLLGVTPNPVDQRFMGAAGGINVPVE